MGFAPFFKIMKRSLILSGILMVVLLFFFLFSKVKNRAQGYVVTSPEAAEILAAIGVEDKIVAVTSECDYPPSLQDKPTVGSFSQISIEKVIAWNPKIVFATVPTQQAMISDLEKLGITTETVYIRTFDDLIKTIRRFGVLTKRNDVANQLADDLQQFIETVDIGPGPRPWVYIEIGDQFWTASDRTFVGEMVKLVGGRVLFHDLPNDYGKVSQEDVVMRNPDVILITYPGVTREDVMNRRGWQDVTACKTGRIYTAEDIDPDLIVRATPRSREAVVILGELLHRLPDNENQ